MDETNSRLLIGTNNPGKIRELSELLAGTGFIVLSLSDVGPFPEPDETGISFEENAALKAAYYASETGLLTLADDSGLEIFDLNGEPGVHSARYGGFIGNYESKMELILTKLNAIAESPRDARFVCAMALARPDGSILRISVGTVEGTIAVSPLGRKGFGYDPIFIPNGSALTFAEMQAPEKHQFSHRRKALDGIVRYLRAQMRI